VRSHRVAPQLLDCHERSVPRERAWNHSGYSERLRNVAHACATPRVTRFAVPRANSRARQGFTDPAARRLEGRLAQPWPRTRSEPKRRGGAAPDAPPTVPGIASARAGGSWWAPRSRRSARASRDPASDVVTRSRRSFCTRREARTTHAHARWGQSPLGAVPVQCWCLMMFLLTAPLLYGAMPVSHIPMYVAFQHTEQPAGPTRPQAVVARCGRSPQREPIARERVGASTR
jgi:hypothetical protein